MVCTILPTVLQKHVHLPLSVLIVPPTHDLCLISCSRGFPLKMTKLKSNKTIKVSSIAISISIAAKDKFKTMAYRPLDKISVVMITVLLTEVLSISHLHLKSLNVD